MFGYAFYTNGVCFLGGAIGVPRSSFLRVKYVPTIPHAELQEIENFLNTSNDPNLASLKNDAGTRNLALSTHCEASFVHQRKFPIKTLVGNFHIFLGCRLKNIDNEPSYSYLVPTSCMEYNLRNKLHFVEINGRGDWAGLLPLKGENKI
jgi:hypothetical protein